jgi:hypothetical protein
MKMGSFPWKKWKYLDFERSPWKRLTRGDALASGEGVMAREKTIGGGGREREREKIIRMDSVSDDEY